MPFLVLNFSVLNACQTELQRVCEDLTHLARVLVGCDFDLGSPHELATVSKKNRGAWSAAAFLSLCLISFPFFLQVLYNRLHLPAYTSLAAELAATRRARKTRLGFGLPLRPRQLPTDNQTLSQLACLHPLPRIVMEWRRLHGILDRVLCGMVTSCEAALHRHEVLDKKNSSNLLISTYLRGYAFF